MVNMITKGKDIPTGKKVLLFSGGMDSLMMNYLLNPDILLVIPHGNKYQKRELEVIENLMKKGVIDRAKVVFDESLELGWAERDDAIIPNRNLYFITLATHYGETIYLGSVYGDRSSDKSLEFFSKCEDMFNYLFKDQHWCENRTFKIEATYKDYTKTELVKLFLEKGGKADDLLTSYSCYDGKDIACGICKPCFRKWVSLENNNINTDNYFENNPWEADWVPQILEQINSPEGYRGREDKEILRALEAAQHE